MTTTARPRIFVRALSFDRGAEGAGGNHHSSRSEAPSISERESILASAPIWDRYIGAGASSSGAAENLFVDSRDVDALREFENMPDESVAELVESDKELAVSYARALWKVVQNITEYSVVRYAVTAVEALLVQDLSARASLFAGLDNRDSFPLGPFMRLLTHEERYIREKAGYIIAMFLSVHPEPKDRLDTFLTWACEQVRLCGVEGGNSSSFSSITSLMVLLQNARTRKRFLAHGGVEKLFKILPRFRGNMQMLYEAACCLWMVSFCKEAGPSFDHSAINELVSLIQSEPREKVTRVAFATIRNTLANQPEREQELSEMLLSRGTLKVLQQIDRKRIKDKDIVEDMEFIEETLTNNYRVLNTWERYEQELLTRKLRRSDLHEDKFWRENARCLEKNNFGYLKMLVEFLDSEDDETVCVACADIGQFVRFYPNGKVIVKNIGGKSKVMSLLAHPGQGVQKEALLCLSKMMVNNWEFLR